MTEPTAARRTYTGLFLVTLATLMYEILLTRIFSVTMWYHFVYVAISIALFGMTVGANLVYLFPHYFTRERAGRHLALSALLFAISIVFSFLTYLSIPFAIHRSLVGVYSIALTYVVISIPFVFSGICVCLALTKFPRQISKLYAADLAGAAAGCILLIYALKVTDGPTAVIVVALLAAAAAALFAGEAGARPLRRIAVLCGLGLAVFAAVHTTLVIRQAPVLRLMWVKGELEEKPLYEKWNSFSRIRVRGNPTVPERPSGWGLSHVFPADRRVRQLGLDIDAGAGTVLTAFDGDLSRLEHLKYDVTNLVHYIRSDARVLIIGSGGGRDILSALVFGQRSVLGIEINEDIIRAVNRTFGAFTGRLDTHPRVRFVHDEARSYIARSRDTFDIIHASLIDTWAATSAGALVFSENTLYTVEAWKLFLDRLTPRGVLTFSRWYLRNGPGEMYRLTSLASASLARLGVHDPRPHIVIIRHMLPEQGTGDIPDGVGTILVGKTPFTDEDLDRLEQITRQLQFRVVLSPRYAEDEVFAAIASPGGLTRAAATVPLNISAPTDDNPFFFNMLRITDVFDPTIRQQRGVHEFNIKAVFVLGVLLVTVLGLAAVFILAPLLLTPGRVSWRGSLPFSLYFACIGLGFMLVEISQLQRLIVFLGHPTYSLSVVLFTLLLSSGVGSYTTQAAGNPQLRRRGLTRLAVLLGALALFGALTPAVVPAFQASTTSVRILLAVATLFPLGLFMGMALPLGMQAASARSVLMTPWLWGVNGATSVCASVLAIAIALHAGISASFWTGVAAYAGAFLAFAWASRRPG